VFPENSQIYCAPIHFIKIDFIRPVIGGREILEYECMKELLQKRIIVNEFVNCTALITEFLLHAADEDAYHVVVLHVVVVVIIVMLVLVINRESEDPAQMNDRY